MNNEHEWIHSFVWNEQTINAFKKDLDKFKKIQFDIFFTQQARKLLGYDNAHKLMNDIRCFHRIISTISLNDPKEKNADILINASEYWKSAELSLMKIKKICSRGERASYKNKMIQQIDGLLKIKKYLGDYSKLSQVKKQWLLHGLITIPATLVIITLVFLLIVNII